MSGLPRADTQVQIPLFSFIFDFNKILIGQIYFSMSQQQMVIFSFSETNKKKPHKIFEDRNNNIQCTEKWSEPRRREMGRSLNALFRGVPQPRHPCIPAMDNLYCKDLAPRTDKRGRERMVQQCMAQVKTHPTYKGIYDVRNYDPSEERGGVKCYFFFNLKTYKQKNGIKRSRLLTKRLWNKCQKKDRYRRHFWSLWGRWSQCSSSCGTAVKTRT
jgi:hypothetical protein